MSTVESISAHLLRKYGVAAPRYTSYPPVPYWGALGPADALAALDTPAGDAQDTLSLYLHVPFCEKRCHYCACFVVITPHHELGGKYADTLEQEMALAKAALRDPKPLRQLHLGGGTPTFLSPARMAQLVARAKALFGTTEDLEQSIEVDPRTVDEAYLRALRQMGFNRLSLGVQDFDPGVQTAVNRIQPYDAVRHLVDSARALGFQSVNFDLIYGLPQQTRDSFERTMTQVLSLLPDRIALYHYAHLPDSHPHQRRMDAGTLPDSAEKLGIFMDARGALLEAGYLAIGLDHFARGGDELSRAYGNGSLQRNFMGYTTQAGTDLLACGVSAISDLRGHYWQNEKKLARYYRAIEAGELPAVRGMRLSGDDRLRRAVINELMCSGRIDIAALQEREGLDFRVHFSDALERLAPLASDGLLVLQPDAVRITERGQPFLRNMAVAFDAYHGRKTIQFSQTV